MNLNFDKFKLRAWAVTIGTTLASKKVHNG